MTKYKRKPPITLPPKVETYAPPVMTFIWKVL
jgi:hypothetical protein